MYNVNEGVEYMDYQEDGGSNSDYSHNYQIYIDVYMWYINGYKLNLLQFAHDSKYI